MKFRFIQLLVYIIILWYDDSEMNSSHYNDLLSVLLKGADISELAEIAEVADRGYPTNLSKSLAREIFMDTCPFTTVSKVVGDLISKGIVRRLGDRFTATPKGNLQLKKMIGTVNHL